MAMSIFLELKLESKGTALSVVILQLEISILADYQNVEKLLKLNEHIFTIQNHAFIT